MLATLNFSISRVLLTGNVEGRGFVIHAVSGFGQGWGRQSDEPPYVPSGTAAQGYLDRKFWGPIPPGSYKVRRPEKSANGHLIARIETHLGPLPFGRDG
jgi:hypothetical protein